MADCAEQVARGSTHGVVFVRADGILLDMPTECVAHDVSNSRYLGRDHAPNSRFMPALCVPNTRITEGQQARYARHVSRIGGIIGSQNSFLVR